MSAMECLLGDLASDAEPGAAADGEVQPAAGAASSGSADGGAPPAAKPLRGSLKKRPSALSQPSFG